MLLTNELEIKSSYVGIVSR